MLLYQPQSKFRSDSIFALSRCFLFIALVILVSLVASVASVTVLMFGKMDSGTRTCNQRIDQQGNDSRLLVEENAELKNMFEEFQIEQKNTSIKLIQLWTTYSCIDVVLRMSVAPTIQWLA